MERIAEFIEHLEEAVGVATQAWIKQLEQINTTSIKEILQEVYAITHSDSHVVITYLRSSAITKSHQFKLAVYPEEPFVDSPIHYTLLDMASLYKEVSSDIQTLINKLSPPYFKILPSEKEEIRRHFTIRLYQQSYHFFKRALKELAPNHQPMQIYFGEEMSELIIVGADK